VPAGSRIRARISLHSTEEKENGLLLTMACVIEIEGKDKLACVAHSHALVFRQ